MRNKEWEGSTIEKNEYRYKSQSEIKAGAAKDLHRFVGQTKKNRRKWFWKRAGIIGILMMFNFSLASFLAIWFVNGKIPSTLYVHPGTNTELLFGVPATGEIMPVQSMGKSNIPQGSVTIDMNQNVTLVTGSEDAYAMKVKLFGFLPFKQVNIQVLEDKKLTPVGIPVGLYLKTDGLLVVGTGSFTNAAGTVLSPAEGLLHTGDYILKIDGKEAVKKQDLMDAVKETHGQPLELLVHNDSGNRRVTIRPALDKTGAYKIGIWVKDSAQGIGTVTYVDEDGKFGALGHGISDVDTGALIHCVDGTMYKTNIVKIRRGEKGKPGELTGRIYYRNDNILGDIVNNDSKGIYGSKRAEEDFFDGIQTKLEPMEIAYKQEIKKGKAQILSALTGEPTLYDVEITNVYLGNDNVNRGIVLKVTDSKLLETTGGIVQGMSGSPIIQNGKLIGAVTHVFVDNPTKGYGIFIESMLEEQ